MHGESDADEQAGCGAAVPISAPSTVGAGSVTQNEVEQPNKLRTTAAAEFRCPAFNLFCYLKWAGLASTLSVYPSVNVLFGFQARICPLFTLQHT